MRKLVVALAVTVMVLGWAGVAGAYWTDLIYQITPFNPLGAESTAEINHTYIDLSNVSNNSVIAHTYLGAAQSLTVDNFSVQEQTYMEAMDKITRHVFELTNRYRPDTDLALSGSDYLPTVHVYTYGAMKDEAMWAIVNGLPDCLNNSPVVGNENNSEDGDGSWLDEYSPVQTGSTIAASIFTINSKTYTTLDGAIVTMDVTPEIIGNKAYLPVRFLAYSLGVPEEGVQWDGATRTVTITKDDTTISLTIGSNIEIVNGEPVQMDVAPYIKDVETGGRTMLPARWVAEPFGAKALWNEVTQKVTIKLLQEQGQ